METWQDIGGAPEDLLTLFKEIDVKMDAWGVKE